MIFASYYLTTALFSVPQEVKELQCSKAGVKLAGLFGRTSNSLGVRYFLTRLLGNNLGK